MTISALKKIKKRVIIHCQQQNNTYTSHIQLIWKIILSETFGDMEIDNERLREKDSERERV